MRRGASVEMQTTGDEFEVRQEGNTAIGKKIRFSLLALIPCEERKWRIPNLLS